MLDGKGLLGEGGEGDVVRSCRHHASHSPTHRSDSHTDNSHIDYGAKERREETI